MKFNIKDIALKSIVAIVFLLAAVGMYKISKYKENAKAEITESVHAKIDKNTKLSAKQKTVEKNKRIDLESDVNVKIKQKHAAGAASYVVMLGIILFIIGMVIVSLSAIYNMIMNPRGLIKSAIGISIFVTLLVVSYFLADATEVLGANNEVLLKLSLEKGDGGYESVKQIASLTKWSGTGLNLTYILLSVSGLLFVGGLLKSLIKS